LGQIQAEKAVEHQAEKVDVNDLIVVFVKYSKKAYSLINFSS